MVSFSNQMQAVQKLILIDAQGFTDGVATWAPRFLSWVGVLVLRQVWLREKAGEVRFLLLRAVACVACTCCVNCVTGNCLHSKVFSE